MTDYNAPSASSDGSITIGTRTFVARAGSLPNPPPPIAVGAALCLTGQLDSSLAFTSLAASTLGDTVCGLVVGFAAPSATAAGTVTIRTNAEWTLPVRSGTTLTSTQTTGNQCFKYELNGQGNAEIVAPAGAPQAGATGGTTTASPAASQPSPSTTSTAPEPSSEPGANAGILIAIAIAGLLLAAGLGLRQRNVS